VTSKLVRQSLFAASFVTIGTTVVSRVFGYVREAVIAEHFGTSAALDVFILAFTVPEFVTFIIFAALPTAIIPVLRKYRESTTADQSGLFWGGMLSFLILFGSLSIAIYLLRDSLMHWLGPTLSAQQHGHGVQLLTIVSPFVFFRGMEAYFRSWLFEKKHFIVPATSTIIVNIVILVAIFGLYDRVDVAALAYGWLAASVILTLYNASFAFGLVKPGRAVNLHPGAVGAILRMVIAIGCIECIALIYPIIDRYLAVLYLGEGQVAALRYATFLIHIPTGVFVVAFTQASFPWISDLSVESEAERLRNLYVYSVRLLVFVMGLVAVGLVIFPSEVVRLSFQRGAFDDLSLSITSGPFRHFAMGIVFYSVYVFQIKFYYARMVLGRLIVILAAMLAVKVLLSYLLVGPMEQNGLALATAVTWFTGCVAMTVDLGRKLGVSSTQLLMPSAPRIVLCLCTVGVFWVWLGVAWNGSDSESLLQLLVRLVVFALSGSTVYLITARLFRLPELSHLYESLRKKVLSGR
jgi:putative peptidoglycan lipid II flippase